MNNIQLVCMAYTLGYALFGLFSWIELIQANRAPTSPWDGALWRGIPYVVAPLATAFGIAISAMAWLGLAPTEPSDGFGWLLASIMIASMVSTMIAHRWNRRLACSKS